MEIRASDKGAIRDGPGAARDASAFALDSLAAGVLVVGGDGRVEYSNAAAARLFGRRLDGVDLHDLDQEGVAASFALAILRALRRRVRVERAEVTLSTEPVRVLGYSITPFEPGGRCTVLFRDITELRRLRDRLDDAEGFALIADVAGAIAHEIRNPLATIAASCELLSDATGLGERDRKLLSMILEETRRTSRVLAAFQEFAQGAPMRKEVVDPIELVAEALDWIAPRAERAPGIQVFFDGETGSLPRLAVPRDAARRVIQNVLQNAYDALVDRGRIDIHISPAAEGTRVAVVIDDDGPGIPARIRDRVVRPFFSTRQGRPGLGLAVAKRVVEQLRGRLAFGESAHGGASVRIELPAVPLPSTSAQELSE